MRSSIILESSENGTFVIVIHVRTCNALHCFAHGFFTFADEHVEVVRHQAVCIVSTVTAAGDALVIASDAHAVNGINELVVILLVLEDILVVDAPHHHMKYPSA